MTEWCRRNLHRPFREQHARLSRMIRGHCAYYGITGNGDRVAGIITSSSGYGRNGSGGEGGTAICRGRASEPCSLDTHCLLRRSSINMLFRERSLRVKNRMWEIRSSGL